MRLQIDIRGPNTAALAAEFMPKFHAAQEADYDAHMERTNTQPWTDEEPATKPQTGSDTDDAPRAYGEPSGGRKRRTKEEMAEDQEIEALAEQHGLGSIPTDQSAEELLADLKSREAPAEALTGDIVEDEPEQPAATRDDLKAAMAALVEAKGGMEDGFPIVMEVFAEYGKQKQSDFPDDPALFAEVIGKLKARM